MRAHRQGEELLAGLTVVVDGVGPAITPLTSALRTLGIGRVLHGAYAAEPALHPAAGSPVAAVLFVDTRPVPAAVAAPWQRHLIPHLPVTVIPGQAVVGPLVLPGRSSCLRCHELLAHAGRTIGHAGTDPVDGLLPLTDEAPPDRPPGPPEAPDPALILLAGALAALTVRQMLLGDHSLAGISSEIRSGRPDVIHRHWPRQGDCCGGPRPGGTLAAWTRHEPLTGSGWTMDR